jgi:hypothetical protein
MYGLVNSLHAPLSIGARVNSLNCFEAKQVKQASYSTGVAVLSISAVPDAPGLEGKEIGRKRN